MTQPLDYYCAIDQYACTRSGIKAQSPTGETVGLDECFWVDIAPCGCMSGILTAVIGDEVVMSEEQARLRMAGSVADAKRDTKLGFRTLLITASSYREHVLAEFQKPCPHKPKWGVVPTIRTVHGVDFERISLDRWRYDGGEVQKLGRNAFFMIRKGAGGQPQYVGRTLSDALATTAQKLAEAS